MQFRSLIHLQLYLLFVLTEMAFSGELPAYIPCAPTPGVGLNTKTLEDVSEKLVQSCLDDLRLQDWKYKQQLKEKAEKEPKPIYGFSLVSPMELPSACVDGDLEVFKAALVHQLANCNKYSKSKLSSKMRFGCKEYTKQEWCIITNQRMLELAKESPNFKIFFGAVKDKFDWYKSDGMPTDTKDGKFKKGDFQFTAYYNPPPIEASAVRTEEYKYAVYKTPPDLVQVSDKDEKSCGLDPITGGKYKFCRKNSDGTFSLLPNRKSIDGEQVLSGLGLEIAYVKDPVDIAFLMVEGSGSLNIRGADGKSKLLRINYDSQNGRTRNMLGRVIRCHGASKKEYSSESGIRQFLKMNASIRDRVLHFDQSYIFFRAGNEGPFGVEDILISPRHSLATDRSIIPTGAVSLFQTQRPSGMAMQEASCKNVASMAVAQDTGGAIVGAHVDWYTGDGHEAKQMANDVNSSGSLYVALPKDAGAPVSNCSMANR